MYKEQSDSKPEEEDTEYITENTTEEIEEPKKEKQKLSHRKEKITFLST